VHGNDRDQVACESVTAYQQLVGELGKLKLPIAADKTECVASDEDLRKLISVTVPCQAGPNQVRQLGADLNFQEGKVKPSRKRKRDDEINHRLPQERASRKWKLKVRAKRNLNFKQRAHKCRTLLSGKVYRKVMRAGLVTAAMYGADIAPIEAEDVARMRTAAIRAEGVWTSQVSQDVYWLVVGPQNDPAFIAAAKPLARMAREVWYLDSNAAFRNSHHDRLTGIEIHELHNPRHSGKLS
jgi:hypothetical protein